MFCPGDRSDKAAFVKLLLNVTKKCDLFHYIYKSVKCQEKQPDLPEVSAETAVSDPFIRRFLRSGSRIGRNDKNASMQ